MPVLSVMYITHLFIILIISSWLSVLGLGTNFQKSNQSPKITNLTKYPIPADTRNFGFNHNAISHVPANYFKNVSNLDTISLYYNLISDIDDYCFIDVPKKQTLHDS